MSIPPLVCSTPPPPEQCEDDKDHEDFDLTYNLSQEDDDSVQYDYGNYSTYNIYPAKSDNTDEDKWPSNGSVNIESEQEANAKSEEIINNVNFIPNDNLFTNNSSKCEENTLEDLNLKVDAGDVHSNDICTEEYETEPHIYNTVDTASKNNKIQDQGGTDEDEFITISEAPIDVDPISETINNDENVDHSFNDLPEISSELTFKENIIDSEKINSSNRITIENEPEIAENMDIVEDLHACSGDDDFGSFEDFQIKNSTDSQLLPINPENPWGDDKESPQRDAFTASFDSKPLEAANNIDSAIDDCDDDFGDFNDFKSSSNTECLKTTEDINLTSAANVPVLSLHSPENEIQIVESINNVLTSIFTKEVSESDIDLDGKLELYLSETWGHLIDIDIRQPYMVNWNNSLGQKTLLKALCIDSRNILFGPKWNYNMPKYAANLTVAPLQPQKQVTQSNVSSSETIEKTSSKDTSTWVDPFTPDGHEYTYAEALLLDLEHLMATLDQMAHKHTTLKISELLSQACTSDSENSKNETLKTPTDLDVIGNEKSSKINKIYSSTINVQPLRHINLPDTHIFTPTDSETPRSKTIHYNTEPTLAPPPPVLASDKNHSETQDLSNEENENEYWEFQDFKGTTSNISTTINRTEIQETKNSATTPKAGTTYQTQILQPIKIEPIMPTLNWPDPGEVKETFDDFSDFISSTSWNNEKDTSTADTKKDVPKLKVSKEELATKTENNDDEFETFQSAPVISSTQDFGLTALSSSENKIPEKTSKTTVDQYDNFSFKVESMNKLSETSSPVLSNHVSRFQDLTFPQPSGVPSVNHHVNNNILQPTNSTTVAISRAQTHNTGQILQPLSLESYSKINWPNPGIDLQDLSRFNPVNSVHSLKTNTSTGSSSKGASPAHNTANTHNEVSDDDIWGDFVSSAPKPQSSPKKTTFADDDEWTDFVSSPSVKPLNGLNTISLNVHTNLSMQKSSSQNKTASRSNQISLDIPTLNYITPKSNNRGTYTEQHFQNL